MDGSSPPRGSDAPIASALAEPRDAELEEQVDGDIHQEPVPRFSIAWQGGPADDETLDGAAQSLTLRVDSVASGDCVLTTYVSVDSGVVDSRDTQIVPDQVLASGGAVTLEVEIAGDVTTLAHAAALSAVADCCGYEEGPACERHGAPTLYITGPGAEEGSVALAGEKALVQDWNSGALDLEVVPGAAAMTRIVDAGGEGQDADAAGLSVQVEVVQ
jgi:hypothetical protein